MTFSLHLENFIDHHIKIFWIVGETEEEFPAGFAADQISRLTALSIALF